MSELEKEILKDFMFENDGRLIDLVLDNWDDYFGEEEYNPKKAVQIWKNILKAVNEL